MSESRTSQEVERLVAEDNARLAQMTDDDIDYSDIPPSAISAAPSAASFIARSKTR